jgi:Flp pilus assembly protein TadD/peroxiredoxin
MTRRKVEKRNVSRREFLKGMRWAPLVFFPAPLQVLASPRSPVAAFPSFLLADYRFRPQYPAKSPLDDVLALLAPGSDAFVTEKYAAEIGTVLGAWSKALRAGAPALDVLGKSVDAGIQASSLVVSGAQESVVRSGYGLEVTRRRFSGNAVVGRDGFLREMKDYFAGLARVETAEFAIVELETMSESPRVVSARIRYDIVGLRADQGKEERFGHWVTEWRHDTGGTWRAARWEAGEEIVSRAPEAIFVDVTERALGRVESYKSQMLRGADHWRTVLDGACRIDVYGNNGVAAGDFDGDGFDDLYICQAAGLPNRLYRNRGNGTFEDVTERSGVGVLDDTACALFADFENRGRQDLLVVCASGPLLFVNEGSGKFSWKKDAFRFARPPAGTFTHAAIADYDRDGRLDVYFCLYSYYLGLDQYRYPAPYYDARNGPPNFLMRNLGGGVFEDRTDAAGLNVDNDRYSFACAWGNAGGVDGNGGPDLYVANDFGRSNLYRNKGDGTFAAVSTEAGVEDPGAGMSACWADFDGDGRQDIYVSNMWSAAGLRISEQKRFHENETEQIRRSYRQHARGNSLYQNQGNEKFKNVATQAGAEMGGWAWSSDVWDFDHDGWPDLYVANGYISNSGGDAAERVDAASFFWRQVVGKSPRDASVSSEYERGWNAINELIRSDTTWNGDERNVFLANNRDGTFSDASGVVGLDFREDGRSFALADLDHDGRLEVVLKNRNAPQLRVLRNSMREIGGSIAVRLQGTKSNRDAIGAAVTIEAEGRKQTKYLQAGSGFLSQHSKEIFFGVGRATGMVNATIQWPSGVTQTFAELPIGSRVEIVEGSDKSVAKPFAGAALSGPAERDSKHEQAKGDVLPRSAETWLIEPLRAPEFSLPDLTGKTRELKSFAGGACLLAFCAVASTDSREQLRFLQKREGVLAASGIRIVAVSIDDPANAAAVKSQATRERLSFPILLATPEVAGVYNIIYRYLFDRRRDLDVPTAFLIDGAGYIVKVYQGIAEPEHIAKDAKAIPTTTAERMSKGLPFAGTLHQGTFQRNAFTYGVAFFQRGYLEQAAASFQQVIEAKPDEPEAYYNLGTLYLRRHELPEARRYLEQAVKLRQNYPEAWNNLGMIAGQEGKGEEAIRNFRQSIALKPGYVIALVNLGNFYRRQEAYGEAERLLGQAIELEPDNAEVNYSVGMLYARENQMPRAIERIERAVSLRPDYADALNNLGVLFVRQEKLAEAKEKFEACIRVAPDFDQAYLNLARLYVLQNDKAKAREVLQSLLEKQPQHTMARQALEMLN